MNSFRQTGGVQKNQLRYTKTTMTTYTTADAKQSIIELIGNTPLLKINSLSKLTGCEIFVKCENRNPGQSIKDRAALQLILDGIENGHLKPGMTIVEGINNI